MTLETARNGAGLPDMAVSVRQVFGIDTDLEVPAYSRPDEHVPEHRIGFQLGKHRPTIHMRHHHVQCDYGGLQF